MMEEPLRSARCWFRRPDEWNRTSCLAAPLTYCRRQTRFTAERMFSQEKGDRFKCSPIPCTCVAECISTARELSACVRMNQPPVTRSPRSHTHKSAHALQFKQIPFHSEPTERLRGGTHTFLEGEEREGGQKWPHSHFQTHIFFFIIHS